MMDTLGTGFSAASLVSLLAALYLLRTVYTLLRRQEQSVTDERPWGTKAARTLPPE